MNIHYFQRYNSKENVATANTMLLLSRLYYYSPNKFYNFLSDNILPDLVNPEIHFGLQEKERDSIPDAVISQESFKILIETKISDWFYKEQLEKHLAGFGDEKCKILITLSSEYMNDNTKNEFEQKLEEYNKKNNIKIIHINTTFENIIKEIEDLLDDRDYEMKDIVEDYKEYCNSAGLIPIRDSWKKMRARAANTTFDFNLAEGVYYDSAERGFSPHDYLGLYKEKSIRAVGKIVAIITKYDDQNIVCEKGALTEEIRDKIKKAEQDGYNYGYSIDKSPHRYFFVDKFYETDYNKTSPRPLLGIKFFDLAAIDDSITQNTPTQEIANILRQHNWE